MGEEMMAEAEEMSWEDVVEASNALGLSVRQMARKLREAFPGVGGLSSTTIGRHARDGQLVPEEIAEWVLSCNPRIGYKEKWAKFRAKWQGRRKVKVTGVRSEPGAPPVEGEQGKEAQPAPAGPQAAPPQSAPAQAAPPQSAPAQAAPPQSAPAQAAPPSARASQAALHARSASKRVRHSGRKHPVWKSLASHSGALALALAGVAIGLLMSNVSLSHTNSVLARTIERIILKALDREGPRWFAGVSDDAVAEMSSRLTIPKRPLKGQKIAPCNPARAQREINGACWVKLEENAPCPKEVFEHEGGCYLPVWKAAKEPLSQ